MKAPRLTEAQLTRQVADFLDWALPEGAVFTHIASGGHRVAAVAGQLRGQGVRRGAPDFVIVAPDQPALFIELKSEAGRLSKEQEKWRDAIGPERWALCRSVEEVACALARTGVRMRTVKASGCLK